jgi:hypothetical protein
MNIIWIIVHRYPEIIWMDVLNVAEGKELYCIPSTDGVRRSVTKFDSPTTISLCK